MRFWLWACVGAVLATGCQDVGSDPAGGAVEDSFQDDDLPMGGCSGTGCASDSGSDGAPQVPLGEPCDGANQCASGSCAATFREREPGPLTCRSTCIESSVTDAWCSDDASCCEGLLCSPRGLCLAAPGSDGGSDSGSESGQASGTTAGDGSSEG